MSPEIHKLLQPERVSCDVVVQSKKKALEQLSQLLATSSPSFTTEEIFLSLIDREKLGSTALGHGVALPHGRVHGREHAIGAFMKLRTGVNFDAADNEPVDLIYALLVPDHFTSEHLQIISKLAQVFNNESVRNQLRQCDNANELYRRLAEVCESTAAPP